MDFSPVLESLPLYVEGLAVTLQLTLLALLAGLALAIPIGSACASPRIAVNLLPRIFVYVVRGTPLLVQLFLLYYGASQFEGLRESPLWTVLEEAWWCALIAFSVNTAGYTAEILRGALVQTPAGEVEAARACGMSAFDVYRRVSLPSAVRRALPAYGNEVIFMLHGSAVAGVVTLVDLFGAARIVNSRHFVPFEAFIACALFYLVITLALVYAFRQLETRLHRHLRPRSS